MSTAGLGVLSRAPAMAVLQAFALPFAFCSKPLIALLAMSWLFYRAYQVLNKPLEELAALLGFDIPAAPAIDIASIRADGVILHWSLPDKQKHKSSFKFELHLNGTFIEALPITETAATITGLQPASFYVVRVSLLNNVDFSSRSEPIRFRTKLPSSGDYFVALQDGNETDHEGVHEPVPRVRPFRGLKDITPASPDAPSLNRESSSSSGLLPRRSIRRSSPGAGLIEKHDPPADENEAPEGAETLQQLTARLDAIRTETDEAEKQAREEEEEELRQKEDLTKERDELKAEVLEKEKASRNLKREVNALERQNTAAQNERTKQERLLQQKKQDRQKLQDDKIRWEQEAEEMKAAVTDIQQKKSQLLQDMENKKEALRNRQAEEGFAIRTLDEQVKEKNAEIRRIERSMRNSSPASGEGELSIVQQMQQDAEDKRAWDLQYQHLQSAYSATAQKLEQANRLYMDHSNYLQTIRARKRQDEAIQYASPPSTQERGPPRRGDSQRSRRAQSGHSSSDSPRLANFPLSSSTFGSGSVTATSAPFFNYFNGMTLHGPTNEIILSDEDRERITGGAPMSPGAGAELLPTDLFADGDNKTSNDFVPPLPGLGSLPGLPTLPQSHEHPGPGPASPASGSSRSPSVFASPQASQQNLHISSPEHIIDADRRSIRSTRSNRATSGSGAGSRFSGMFGIKQKNKAPPAEDDGLSLGKALSHSMPRQDQGIPGIDSSTRKRNSSVSGSNFSLTGDSVFDAVPLAPPSRRSRALNFFSKDKGSDGWPSTFAPFNRRPASPRPGSTHSSELPRPSMDSTRWGVVDGWPNEAARSSPLAFGTGWNAPAASSSRLYGSRHPSRRPSQQYGNSGPPEDIIEDEDDSDLDEQRALQFGAIGTKPPMSSFSRAETETVASDQPRLNPNAKDFKSFFSKGIRLSSKDKGGSSAQASPNPNSGDFEHSPPNSRKSKDTRDTRSLATTESSIAESGRTSADLARTPSCSTSDAPAPSPLLGGSSAGKAESFMSKLTRKSSSSKFNMPRFSREKSNFASPTTASSVSHTEELEDAPLSSSVGSLPRESKETQRNSSRNWSNVLKLGSSKKKGNETPSLSGMSMTSGATEDGERELA